MGKMNVRKTVIAGAIGECVHIAGVSNFLKLAEQVGWRVVFLGPATPIRKIIKVAKEQSADLVGVSYRLTPENGEQLLAEFAEAADELHSSGVRFAFGGTPEVAECARRMQFFEVAFDGTENVEMVLAYLKGNPVRALKEEDIPQTAIERIIWKSPLPLIRHHFGLPDYDATLKGVQEIAEAEVLDVISLGIDQDAQEFFFHPEKQKKRRKGAGGVPVRNAEDYRQLYQATRTGNHPLIRTYSGTNDLIRLAEMYVETINIAWAAVPLYWFNRMDGRGPLGLEESIRKHQELMSWYGQRKIPVEANEAHHWGMRNASDVIFVTAAYLAAYNARAFGVRDHIVQMMFNSPPGASDMMDLAKMLALKKLISRLEQPGFKLWWQTRTGLLSYPVDMNHARAHLATTVFIQMLLKPDILHVVGYPEANHAVSAKEVIESCKMARWALRHSMRSNIELINDAKISKRVEELVKEVSVLLEAIRKLGNTEHEDPLTDVDTLAKAVRMGILDAPQLKDNSYGRGEDITGFDERGACVSLNPQTGTPFDELNRIAMTLGLE
jgi:methylmalonyl-CoA mutase cobalamin-binding subunit